MTTKITQISLFMSIFVCLPNIKAFKPKKPKMFE